MAYKKELIQEWLYTTFAPCVRLNFDPSVIGVNVGVAENINTFKFNIFPNPNNGQFNIQFQNLNSKNIVLNISNLIGQVVYSEKIPQINSFNKSLDLSHLLKGVYTINIIEKENTLKTQKIIIK